MEFLEIVQKRRSLRSYAPTPVEPEKLNYVLECARLAPSWKNFQGWRFIVVKDPETRQALADSLTEGNPGRKVLVQSPIAIVLCAIPDDSEVWEGKDYMLLDAGLAMEHLILAATEQGLGTCWEGLFYEDMARKALNIPENVRVVAFTPLGYASEERRPRPRKSLDEIVFYEKWK